MSDRDRTSESENGEAVLDPDCDEDDVLDARARAERLHDHKRPISSPIDPAATRPDPDPS